MDARLFNATPAVITFEDGTDSNPDHITRTVRFNDHNTATGKRESRMGPVVEFCVEPGSESQTNLMQAAMAQSTTTCELVLYVKHADGSVWAFQPGQFMLACEQRGIFAGFREARRVSPAVYAALRGPDVWIHRTHLEMVREQYPRETMIAEQIARKMYGAPRTSPASRAAFS